MQPYSRAKHLGDGTESCRRDGPLGHEDGTESRPYAVAEWVVIESRVDLKKDLPMHRDRPGFITTLGVTHPLDPD